MKYIVSTVLMFMASVSFAQQSGQVSGLDCRAAKNYWSTNKGFKVDLTKMTVTSYKDNGYTKGSTAALGCEAQDFSIRCEAEDFAFELPDVRVLTAQESSDASDILGSIVGGRPKRAMVTSGVLQKKGILFKSESALVCILR